MAILVIFVIMLGFGIIAPILPLYARSFGVGYEAASLLISVFAMARLVTDPVAGPIVDRFGERMTSMAGVLIVGVSAFLAGIAPTFTLAVIFRGSGGVGSAILFAALYSYLLKVVPADRMARTLSLFFGALNVGIIAGGPIGGLLADAFALNTPLFVYAGLCLVAGALYLRYLPDVPARRAEGEADEGAGAASRRAVARIADLVRRPGFLTVLALNFSFFWVVAGAYDTLIPLFGREGLGMSTVGVGAAFAAIVLAEFVVLYPAGTAADRFGRRPVLLPALAGMAIVVALLGFAGSPVALGLLCALVGFASGATAPIPTAMLSDVVPEERSGTAVGLFRFAGDLGFVFGPLVAGVSASGFGFRGAFAVMAIPLVAALVLALRTPETLRRVAARPAPTPSFLDEG